MSGVIKKSSRCMMQVGRNFFLDAGIASHPDLGEISPTIMDNTGSSASEIKRDFGYFSS